MKKNMLFALLFLGFSMRSQITLQTVYETPNSQINLYIVSQGYDNSHINEFDTFVSGLLNRLWTTVPFNEYQEKFRVITVKDIASTNGFPRAYNQFTPPTLCPGGSVNGSETYETFKTRMDNLISTNIPNFNDNSYLIAIFNNDYYTGGGGKYVFATENCYGAYMYDVVIHEFGHSFGLLGDEYATTTASVSPNDFPIFHDRNVTTYTNLTQIPWEYLISPSTPLPTCLYNNSCGYTVTGLYQGANYSTTDWYRPQNDCKMLHVTQPFCLTCQDLLRETIIKHLCYSNISITENFISRHQYIKHWRKSTNNLSSTSIIGNKIDVVYLAQNQITLTNGFHARSGSDLRAYIGDCSYIDTRNTYKTLVGPKENTNSISKTYDDMYYEVENSNDIQIYPNPAKTVLNITSDSFATKTVEIYNVLGAKVLTATVNNNTVNVADLANGVYLIKVTEEGKTATRKLVIE